MGVIRCEGDFDAALDEFGRQAINTVVAFIIFGLAVDRADNDGKLPRRDFVQNFRRVADVAEHDLELEFSRQAHGGLDVIGFFGGEHDRALAFQIRK